MGEHPYQATEEINAASPDERGSPISVVLGRVMGGDDGDKVGLGGNEGGNTAGI